MTFIRAKQIPPKSGNWYDYEVESYREKGKVKQRVIQYIGRSGRLSGSVSLGRRDSILMPTDSPIPNTQPKLKVVCKFCGSQHTRKYGLYKGVQNYYCDDCNTKFTGTDALAHGRVSPDHIVNALNEFYDGMSYHEIENSIENRTDNDISHTAVMKWVNKYTKEAIRQTKDFKPEVGDTWIADETYIRIDKLKPHDAKFENPYSRSTKAKWVVFWDIIDADTRFLLASVPATSRSISEAKELMLKAAKRAGKIPKVVVTDKLKSYIDGIELAFGAGTKHVQGKPFQVENNTNLIERFHGTIKDRTKVMRALRTRTTLKTFMDGWLVYYNFFRPHMSLDGKRPAEKAGLNYDSKCWADIVGIEKQPIVKILEPEPVEGSNA
ncbi:MAG: IS1/IS6 family transposase [Dehalococcoidales bacterium]|nr:IS1/IS6 family transposase [Dehalococcoidales bacterium]